jgi:hypothetical protein
MKTENITIMIKQIAPYVIAVLLFFTILFGFTGLKTSLAIMALFIMPAYLILENFNFDTEEKIIASIILGIGAYSTMTYYSAVLFGSMKLAMIISFVVLIAIGLIIRKLKKKKKK